MDNVLTVLLAVAEYDALINETDIQYPAGLPAGEVVISGLFWPQDWLDATGGPLKKIPVIGYRTSGFGVWDGTAFHVTLTARPQV